MCGVCKANLPYGQAAACHICRREVTSYVKIFFAGVPLTTRTMPPPHPPAAAVTLVALMNEADEEVRVRAARMRKLCALEEHLGENIAMMSSDELLGVADIELSDDLLQMYMAGDLVGYANGMLKAASVAWRRDSMLLHYDKLSSDERDDDKSARLRAASGFLDDVHRKLKRDVSKHLVPAVENVQMDRAPLL